MTTFKKEFEDKLNELGIKEAFEANRVKLDGADSDELNLEDEWRSFISNAFVWKLSYEGHKYWEDISKK